MNNSQNLQARAAQYFPMDFNFRFMHAVIDVYTEPVCRHMVCYGAIGTP